MDDKVQLTTFKAGLKSRKFVVPLAKYMNAEDSLATIGEESMSKGKESAREDRKGCKRERKDR